VLPDAVHDVIRGRIDSLDPSVRDSLEIASVLGDAIDSAALSHLLQVDRAASLRLIEQMVTARLVTARPNGGYTFAHALMREVFYKNMQASVRATLHGRCAQYLEASGIPIAASELAYHYHHALPIGFAPEAFRYATQAAEDASKTHAMADATTYYEWALAAMEHLREADPRRRCELLFQQAEAHQTAGHQRRARTTLERAIDLALQHKYGDLLSRAGQTLRPTFLWGAMRDDLALRALEGALRLLPDGDNSERAVVMSHLSCIPPYSRPLSRAQQLSDDAIAMARRLGDQRSLAEALRARLATLTGPDTIDALQTTADELQKIGHASGFAWVDREVGNARFYGLLQRGDLEGADRALAKRDLTVRSGRLLEASWNIDRLRVQRQFDQGDITGAIGASAKLIAQAERMGLAYGPMYRVFSSAHTTWEQHGARSVVDNADIWGPLSRWAPLNPYHGALVARLLAEANVLDEAREHYGPLLANDFADIARDLNFLSALCHLSVVACTLRDQPGARAIYNALEPYSRLHATSFYGTSAGSVSRYLGLLSATLDEPQRAREQLEHAVAENRRMGLKFELAHTETDLAKLKPKRR
jgi:tetratricopeptide (TPR) repeat protein